MTSMVGVDRRTSLGDLNFVDGANLLFNKFESSLTKGEENKGCAGVDKLDINDHLSTSTSFKWAIASPESSGWKLSTSTQPVLGVEIPKPGGV